MFWPDAGLIEPIAKNSLPVPPPSVIIKTDETYGE